MGCSVIATSRRHVRWSTTPVASSPRLAWKPRTASRVAAAYVPVVVSGSHASWKSRCWSSRTCTPVAPGSSTFDGVGVDEGCSGLGDRLGDGVADAPVCGSVGVVPTGSGDRSAALVCDPAS